MPTPTDARGLFSSITPAPDSDKLYKVPISANNNPSTPKSSGRPSGNVSSFLLK